MPGNGNLVERSEEIRCRPFWSTSSTALIRKEYSEQSRKQSCSPKTKTSSRPTTPKTSRPSFHERTTPASGRYSSRGLGLIMAFFQSSGSSPFGMNNTAANNGGNSQAQAQTGPDLEEILTEVSHLILWYTI